MPECAAGRLPCASTRLTSSARASARAPWWGQYQREAGTVKTLLGDEVDALFVKGSGWNLGTIEPAGFPAVDLAHMRRVAAVPTLSDEAMVNEQRTHLFDAASPNPSIETLVHAVIDATYVDHSHADAILALTNHPEGERRVREALGSDIVPVDYVKSVV